MAAPVRNQPAARANSRKRSNEATVSESHYRSAAQWSGSDRVSANDYISQQGACQQTRS